MIAFNDIGHSPPSVVSNFVAVDPPTVPDQPQPPTVQDISPDSAIITWSVPVFDGGSTITSYVIEWTKEGDEEWKVGLSKSDITTYTVQGLTAYTSYVFRVTAANTAGFSEPSNRSQPIQYGKYINLFCLCPVYQIITFASML